MTSRKAFTVIEMLTAVAGLVILSGLMVSLARHVRATSANELTRRILHDLAIAMDQYLASNGGSAPIVSSLLKDDSRVIDEADLRSAAQRNSTETLRVLRRQKLSKQFLTGLPEWMFDQATLRDAWGTPIVYVRSMHPLLGMAPSDEPFFFSAGPDRRFLTRDDNLYSYEERKRLP